MSALSNVAAIASALAPLLQNYLKTGSKPVASRGQRGPSATSAPQNKRQSKRSQRRRRNKPRDSSFTTGFPSRMSTSVSVAGRDYKTYFKQSGTPVHKEWGEGIRFRGCSVLGVMQVPNSGVYSFSPTVDYKEGTAPADITYFDLYAACSGDHLERIVYTLHPALITRLQNETLNWGRYCYRWVQIHSEAQDTTSDQNGYVAGLTHDVSWPLLDNQADGPSDIDIAELGNHSSGPFYRSFNLRSADFKGDRTWPTGLPVLTIDSGATDSPPSSFLAPYIEDYYQFCWATTIQGSLTSGFAGTKGFVYLTYEIDFYSVKSDLSSNMQPINWLTGVNLAPRRERKVRVDEVQAIPKELPPINERSTSDDLLKQKVEVDEAPRRPLKVLKPLLPPRMRRRTRMVDKVKEDEKRSCSKER